MVIPSVPTVLDVTLRDGGYVNGHSWSAATADRIVEVAARAGLAGSEVGYYRPWRHSVDGEQLPAASSPPAYVERLRATAPAPARIAVMVHRGEVDPSDYRRLAASGADTVRLPTRFSEIDEARRHVDAVHEAGMQVAVNLLRVSECTMPDVAMAAAAADRAAPDVFYVADSNSGLFPDDVERIVGVVREHTDLPIGIHAHDGLSLAFVNTLVAIDAGATHVDASIGGIGKGGGNLRAELFAAYLRARMGASVVLGPLAAHTATVLAERPDLPHPDTIVSGLLNLNVDDIARLQGTDADLVSLLDHRTAAGDTARP